MSRPLWRTVPLKSRTSYLMCVHLCVWWSGSALDFPVLIVWLPKCPHAAGLSREKVMVSSKCFCQWLFCILSLAFLPNACYPTHSNCTFQTEQNLLDFLQQTMRKAFLDWLRTFLPWFPCLHAANAFSVSVSLDALMKKLTSVNTSQLPCAWHSASSLLLLSEDRNN